MAGKAPLPPPRREVKTLLKGKVLSEEGLAHGLWWKWEVACCLLALIGLVALIVGLDRLDGRPEQTWGHLTLNTVVAALTTVISSSLMAVVSSAMSQSLWNWMAELPDGGDRIHRRRLLKDLHLFDQASRGPLGGSMLIWRLRGWHPAVIGAILTILNLALGLFTQLAVTTQDQLVPNGVALPFARSEYFTHWSDADDIVAANSDALLQNAAIYTAATGGNVTGLLPSCSTSNCTYPVTPTLAMCGACSDISSQLNDTGTCDPNSRVCGYSLPNGANLTYNESPGVTTGNVFTIIHNLFPLEQLYNNDTAPSTPLVYNDPAAVYATVFDVIGLPAAVATSFITDFNESEASGQLNVPPMQAHECALWWCVQSYNVSVKSGITAKTLTNTWSKFENLQDGEQSSSDGRLNFADLPADMNSQPDPTYGVNMRAYYQLADALKALTIPQAADGNRYTPTVRLAPSDTQPGIFEFTYLPNNDIGIGTDIRQGLWEGSDNLHDAAGKGWIDNLAQSLTNFASDVNSANVSAPYNGTTWTPQSFFLVRWAYLAFPIAVVLLSFVFLALTAWETRRKRVRPWKVGIMAFLFVDLDERLRRRAVVQRALDTHDGLCTIEREEVRLRPLPMGHWGFVLSHEPEQNGGG